MSEQVKGPASYFPSIERTYGRPIAEWKALLRAHGPARHGELVTWLKTEHGLGHGHANALVADTLREDREDPRTARARVIDNRVPPPRRRH